MRLADFDRPFVALSGPSTGRTLAVMVRLARAAQARLDLRRFALSRVARVTPRDGLGELASLYYWVLCHVRYVRDGRTVEEVGSPEAVLENGQGDCDDMAVLLASLAGHLGYRSRFVAVGFAGRPASHVFVEVFEPVSRRWVVLDPVPGRRTADMLGRAEVRLVMPAVGGA